MSPRDWFPAKRNGWGWGLPLAWEGWAVLAAFIALIVGDTLLFPPRKDLAAYIAGVVGLSVLLVAVCWLMDEPFRWRWGDDDDCKH